MKIIRDNLKISVENSSTSSVILLCFSLLLTACGGGGPGDEGENAARSTTSTHNSAATSASFTRSSTTTEILNEKTAGNQELLCQQQNSLLCEDFEWSSSLAYKASPVDWSLKGWQFAGVDSSGNFCNTSGAGGSQCALKWIQKNDKLLDIEQRASYSYSEYGAGFNQLSLSWAAKWSEQWVWDTESKPHLVLESRNATEVSHSLFLVAINSNGFIQLMISADAQCTRDELIIESEKNFALQGSNLGKWQQFQIEFNLDTAGINNEVRLSVNNEIIISKTDIKLGCSSEYSAPNTVSFIVSSYNQLINTEQNVLVDNVLINYE